MNSRENHFRALKDSPSRELGQNDSTFERHFSIHDLSALWNLSRETIRQLIKNEPGILRVQLGRRKTMTRYSIPESVARRVHTKLLHSHIIAQ
jgi:hypothetical protein